MPKITIGQENQEAMNEQYRQEAVSLLLKRRAVKKAARRVLLSKKTTLLLLILILIFLTTCTASYIQEKMGNFTINLNRIDMYRQGISLSDEATFEEHSARLVSETVKNATNITLSDLPENIDEIDGQHNGENYMAYTFYMRNGGEEDIDYYTSIVVDSQTKGVDNAVRVVVYDDTGNRTVYAKRAKNGEPEPGTVPFYANDIVMNELVTDFKVGEITKYCVVIFLEGEDPECIDDIIGGMIRLTMDFDIKDTYKDR